MYANNTTENYVAYFEIINTTINGFSNSDYLDSEIQMPHDHITIS